MTNFGAPALTRGCRISVRGDSGSKTRCFDYITMQYIEMDESGRQGSLSSLESSPISRRKSTGSLTSVHLRRRGDSASPLTIEGGDEEREDQYYAKSPKDYAHRQGWAALIVISMMAIAGAVSTVSKPLAERRKLLGSRRPGTLRSRRILQKIESGFSQDDKALTVLLTGHRIDLLQRSLESHADCDVVHEIQIDWDGRALPSSLLNHVSNKVKSVGDLSSNGLLVLDESVQLSCQEIERAFSQWREDPVRLVGFSSMHANQDSTLLLSSKALVAHRLYIDGQMAGPKADNTCGHLVLSAQVAAMTRKAPVVVAAKPKLLTRDEPDSECVPRLLKAVGLKASSAPESLSFIGGR